MTDKTLTDAKEIARAIQFTGNNCFAVIHFLGGPWTNPELHNTDSPYVGDEVAEAGDWIIRTSDGFVLTRQVRILSETTHDQ